MIFVIVSQNGVVIGKESYAGDTSGLQEKLDKRQIADPTLSFEILEEKDHTIFDSTVVPPKITPEQIEWQAEKAKGTAEAMAFLAKRLGLE